MITGLSEKQIHVLKNANKRWNILCGATRSGKTVVSFLMALKHIREHYNENIVFIGKTINTLDRNVFEEMRKNFGEEHIGKIIDKREIDIFGKRCYVIGANDDRAITKIQGASFGYAYCDEVCTFPENFFSMLKSRLDTPNACCDATCNPESPSHFIKQFIDKPDVGCYSEHFTIYDNTFLNPDFVKALENEYRGTIYFDRWILGKWVKTEGLVFPLFNRKKHFLTPDEYARKFGRNRLRYVIFGCDGANINDATAIVPLAIMSNGQAVTLEMFYHNPKLNGQLSNEQLMPFIQQYLNELNAKYRLVESGAEFYTCVDAAAADLRLMLSYHLPEWYNVRPYTKKNLFQTTDTVNNAFARGVLRILDFGGHYNYWRKSFESGVSQLVVDLELMTWDKTNEHFDNKIPNDCADAFRYAVCTYFENPENIWETPNTNDRFKEMEEER